MNIIENLNAEVLDSVSDRYDVSVCIITYNKEKYIQETIDSVLMQKTNCRYEIVVGDNLSTDGTRDILRSYWENDKEKFTIILNEKNLGLTTNIYNTMRKAKGKYIIILYGDDYWITENKIQAQFDFLEHNMQYIGVTSAIESRYDGENIGFRTFPCRRMRNNKCTLDDYLSGYDFPMAGVMFRNEVFSQKKNHFNKMLEASLNIDDLSFCILLLMEGDVFVLPEKMGVYRCFRPSDNAGNFNSVNPKIRRDEMSIELLNNLDAATDERINLDIRYGLILASSFFSMINREIDKADYINLENKINERYRQKKRTLMLKGLYKKIVLSTIEK